MTLLFCFAHPDDESFCGAGTAMRYAAAGARIVLVTATLGQRGKCGDPPVCRPEEIEATRERELREAARVIGFDALPEALQAVQDGTLAATVEQFPGGQTSGAMDILITFLRDGTEPAEHDNYIEPALITADNLGEAERAEEAGIEVAAPEATPAA